MSQNSKTFTIEISLEPESGHDLIFHAFGVQREDVDDFNKRMSVEISSIIDSRLSTYKELVNLGIGSDNMVSISSITAELVERLSDRDVYLIVLNSLISMVTTVVDDVISYDIKKHSRIELVFKAIQTNQISLDTLKDTLPEPVYRTMVNEYAIWLKKQ